MTVRLDVLADRVWGDGDLPKDPKRTLRTYFTRLRRALGDTEAVLTNDEGSRLNANLVALDTRWFEDLAQQASAPGLDAHGRLAILDRALELYRGRPFGDLAEEDWVRSQSERFEELRATLVERRFQAMLDAGKHTDALPGLAAEVEVNPLRDRLVGHQMLALFRTGRQAEATRVFQKHRMHLSEELGLEPGSELVELDRRVVAGDPSLLLAESPGQALRGYRIGEQVGEGAFAMVYRGTQPTLGRDVAVKIIRSELANRPEFIRRFEAEAHLVARLEHPHIVPLYDYWREPDRAYLVFRYLRGGTLEARLTSGGPLDIDEAVRLVDHVGSALAGAHAAGVVHRDVKPANVFLDNAGNYYLGDFGIALEATELSDPTAALSAGSPAYAAPEQLRRETIGPAADVHGLGISLYEALTARLPFPEAVSQADLLRRQLEEPIPAVRLARPDLPAGLDRVIARATAKDPVDRYQMVDELIEDFGRAVGRSANGSGDSRGGPTRAGTTTAVSGDERNPYKGLRAFTEADAGDFRGRERLVDRLVGLLSRSDSVGRMVAVVGPSGIGKSSVVRAGLLPALRSGAVPRSAQWFVASMLPGSEPFEELAAALLRVASHTPNDLMDLLAGDHRGIARVVKTLVPEDSDAEVLLLIDQFEELFTLVTDDRVRRRFLDALVHAVTDARCPLRVVLTMRADFWDRPLRYGAFAQLIEQSTVMVTALAPDELERAIVEPAAAVGSEFEPGLVSEISADVADQPGSLPLLQYALTELWEQRISGLLTRDAYRSLGGVAGALARRAEALHDDASVQEQATIRRVFGRLVNLGEGTEDTRRRVLRTELGDAATVDGVLERYGEARLLSFDRDPATREPTVEVAHEALLRQWPRLRSWLEEDRDDLRVLRHLTEAASGWETGGRDDGDLYRGGRLEVAETLASKRGDELTSVERAFLDASIALRQHEKDVEIERFEQELRNNRRLRRLLSGVAVLLALALVAGSFAFLERGRANDEAARATTAAATAETRRLVADAGAIVTENRDIALLLASEAYRRDPSPQTLAGLQRVLTNTGNFLGTIGDGESFIAGGYLDDGTIVGVTANEVQYYDPTTRALISTVSLPDLVTATDPFGSPVARLYDSTVILGTESGDVLKVNRGTIDVVPVGDVPVKAVAWSPSLDLLAVGDASGMIHLIDASSGAVRWSVDPLPELSHREVMGEEGYLALGTAGETLTQYDGLVFGSGKAHIDFENDGSLLVAVGTFLRRMDLADGTVTAEILLEHSPVPDVVPPFPRNPKRFIFTDERRQLVVLAGTSSVAVVDSGLTEAKWSEAATGRTSSVLPTSVMVDPDGVPWFGLSTGLLASGTTDGPADADPTVIGLGSVSDVSLSPDGRALLAAGEGGMVLWAIDGSQLLARAAPRSGNTEAWISADGEQLIVSDLSGAIESRIYDISGPNLVEQVVEGVPMTYNFFNDFDPLNKWFVAVGDSTARHIDRQTMRPNGFETRVGGIAVDVSPDGRYIVATGDVSRGSWFRVIDLETGDQVSPDVDVSTWASNQDIGLNSIVYHPSGEQLLVSLESGTTVEFDTTTWQAGRVIELDDAGGARAARYSRVGDVLVTRGVDGTIAIRHPDTFDVVRTIEGGTGAGERQVFGPFISPDGQYLLTLRETTPRLWHLPTGTVIGTFPNEAGLVASGNDEGDELEMASLLGDHALVWNLNVESWPEIACLAAGRNMTAEEWDQFGPADQPHQATCPQWTVPS
ncbi:MAG: protein kinase domain-containing protein [Acidimicrobiales bacterium]